MAISFFSMIVLYLWESMAVKASTLKSSGPVMLPMYFIVEVTQAYLYLTVPFGGMQFWVLLLSQEVMGIIRNVGLYDIAWWATLKFFKQETPFPHRDQNYLESLITIAAVDTVAEALSACTFIFMIIGYHIGKGPDQLPLGCIFDNVSLKFCFTDTKDDDER